MSNGYINYKWLFSQASYVTNYQRVHSLDIHQTFTFASAHCHGDAGDTGDDTFVGHEDRCASDQRKGDAAGSHAREHAARPWDWPTKTDDINGILIIII